ncbi:hypothetical protein [Massilibacterium senegalense]|uniref:hypothetical protein n=1 Tax=Massilibacterium senegalense TaxID=1632858 RepID=UPI000780E903|nr:hypothetical protein [Massilibacterium senegalense]
MKKKSILFVFLTILATFMLFIELPVKASSEVNKEDPDISINDYEELIQKDVLSNDIDHETWIDINKQIQQEEFIYF